MGNKFKILIVEDELLIAEMLKEMLLELNYEVIGIAKSYDEATSILSSNVVDLAILDINLNGEKNGIDIGNLINEKYNYPFIYLTSYSDATSIKKATESLPSSYLIKPFKKNDLFATIEMIRARSLKVKSAIVIKDGHLNIKLNTNDIYSIKSDNNYLEINTLEKKYTVRNSLDNLLMELNNLNFIRIHRSHAVNILSVEAVNGQYVIIKGEKFPLSRKYRGEVLKQFSKV